MTESFSFKDFPRTFTKSTAAQRHKPEAGLAADQEHHLNSHRVLDANKAEHAVASPARI